MKKTFFLIATVSWFCHRSTTAQTISTTSSNALFGTWESSFGFAKISPFGNPYPSYDVFSKIGNQLSFSFSYGGERSGFHIDYLLDQNKVDLEATTKDAYSIDTINAANKSFQTGVIIGPYFNSNMKIRKIKGSLWFDVLFGMGAMHQQIAGISGVNWDGYSFKQEPIERTQVVFQIGWKFRYNFLKKYSTGIKFSEYVFIDRQSKSGLLMSSAGVNVFFASKFKL